MTWKLLLYSWLTSQSCELLVIWPRASTKSEDRTPVSDDRNKTGFELSPSRTMAPRLHTVREQNINNCDAQLTKDTNAQSQV